MGTTTAGIPYPEPSDPVANVDLAIKAVAEAVAGLDTAPTLVPAAGWTLGGVHLRRVAGAWAWVELIATRAAGAATITAATPGGNITNSDITTLPVGWRPTRNQYLSADRASESAWSTVLTATGLLQLSHGAPGATVVAGDTLVIADMFALF